MRLTVHRGTLRRALVWIQRLLFAGAAALFAYCGFVMVDAFLFQRAENLRLEQLLVERRAAGGALPAPRNTSAKPQQPPVDGSLIGRIQVARLGLSAIVIEGTTRATLRRAVGHIAGTSLPGQTGNTGLAGHRDSLFRPLRNIRRGDLITLTTESGEFRYRVLSTIIVKPDDVGVLVPDHNEILTLVTCYPFAFVGSAPDRFIVRAKRE